MKSGNNMKILSIIYWNQPLPQNCKSQSQCFLLFFALIYISVHFDTFSFDIHLNRFYELWHRHHASNSELCHIVEKLFSRLGITFFESDKKFIENQHSLKTFDQFMSLLNFILPYSKQLEAHKAFDDLIARLFLHCSINSLRNPRFLVRYQDMSQPISEYLISTTHNTYLSGNQIKSATLPFNYELALREGFKGLEIDVWDGTNSDSTSDLFRGDIADRPSSNIAFPKVYHGYTLTDNNVFFPDVIQVIKEKAFVNSPYPLFLFLEIRCSIDFQNAIVNSLQEILGSMLLPPFSDAQEINALSPNDLKNKILICLTGPQLVGNNALPYSENLLKIAHFIEKTSNNSEFLKEKFPNLGLFTNISEDNLSSEIVEKSMFRIYPRGSRLDSSNFDPRKFWNLGVQFVAMNRQTPG